MYMVYAANSSWTGLVVKNSYVASQNFNELTQKLEASKAFGLHGHARYDNGKVVISITDASGNPVSITNPVLEMGDAKGDANAAMPIMIQADGTLAADKQLAVGLWSGIVSGTVPGKGEWAQVGVHSSCTMSCCTSHGFAEVATDKALGPSRLLIEELKSGARSLPDGSVNYMLSVPVIHCGNCIATIERVLVDMPGVKSARANLSLRQVSVTLDDHAHAIAPVVDALEQAGFPPQPASVAAAEGRDPEFKALVRALAVAGFASANIMLLSVSVWTGAEGATKGSVPPHLRADCHSRRGLCRNALLPLRCRCLEAPPHEHGCADFARRDSRHADVDV